MQLKTYKSVRFSSNKTPYTMSTDTVQKVSTSTRLELFETNYLENHYSGYASCLKSIREMDERKNLGSLFCYQKNAANRVDDCSDILKLCTPAEPTVIKKFIRDVNGGFALVKFKPETIVKTDYNQESIQIWLNASKASKQASFSIRDNPAYELLERKFIRAFSKVHTEFVHSLLTFSTGYSEILILYACEFHILQVIGLKPFIILYCHMHTPNEFISVLQTTMTHLVSGNPTDGYDLFTNHIYEKRHFLIKGLAIATVTSSLRCGGFLFFPRSFSIPFKGELELNGLMGKFFRTISINVGKIANDISQISGGINKDYLTRFRNISQNAIEDQKTPDLSEES